MWHKGWTTEWLFGTLYIYCWITCSFMFLEMSVLCWGQYWSVFQCHLLTLHCLSVNWKMSVSSEEQICESLWIMAREHLREDFVLKHCLLKSLCDGFLLRLGWISDVVLTEREKYTQIHSMCPLSTASQGSTVLTFKQFNGIQIVL